MKRITKTCSRCGAQRPLSEFGWNWRTGSGHLGVCRECLRAAQARYRDAVRYRRPKALLMMERDEAVLWGGIPVAMLAQLTRSWDALPCDPMAARAEVERRVSVLREAKERMRRLKNVARPDGPQAADNGMAAVA